jgi:hypothetical protein
MLFVVCNSTEAHRFLADLRGWRLVESRKQLGYRALLLKRREDRPGYSSIARVME